MQIVSNSHTSTTNTKDFLSKPNYNIVNELNDFTEVSLF